MIDDDVFECSCAKSIDNMMNAANSKELVFLLQHVPFEYCKKAYDSMKLNDAQKSVIALRDDCTEDVLMGICSKAGVNLARDIAILKRFISDDALRMLANKDKCLNQVVIRNGLSDTLIDEFMPRIIKRDESGNVIGFSIKKDYALFFLSGQPAMNAKHLDDLENAFIKEYEYKSDLRLSNAKEMISFMRTPIDEDAASKFISTINDYDCYALSKLLKIACNPSISDFIIMQLRIDSPAKYLDMVNKLIDLSDIDRKEYREKYKEAMR